MLRIDAICTSSPSASRVVTSIGIGRAERAHGEQAARACRRAFHVGRRRRGEIADGVALGKMAVDGHRHADAAVAEDGDEAGDRRGQFFGRDARLGPKSESCARRGRSGCATNEKPTTGAPGGVFSRSRRISVSIVFDVARRRRQVDAARVVAVGIERQRELEPLAGEALDLHPLRQAVERGVGDEEERLERDERPLQLHPFAKLRRQRARHERTRIDAARGPVQLASDLAEAAGDFAFGKLGEIADRCRGPSAAASPPLRARARDASAAAARGTSASSPGATTVGDFGSSAATRAASLLAAMPTRAGRPIAVARRAIGRARASSSSLAKCRSIPVTSRNTTPSPASSTRGENVSATSSSASCAVRSHSASRPRAMSFGRSERACASDSPGWIPFFRARRVAATMCALLPLPSTMPTASLSRSGSLRSRAASGNIGT